MRMVNVYVTLRPQGGVHNIVTPTGTYLPVGFARGGCGPPIPPELGTPLWASGGPWRQFLAPPGWEPGAAWTKS